MKIVIEKEEGQNINGSINGSPIEVIEGLSYVLGVYFHEVLKEGEKTWENTIPMIDEIVIPRIKDGFLIKKNGKEEEE